MKKKVILAIILVILVIAGVGVGVYVGNMHSDPSKNQTNNGENVEPQELTVDFFGEFVPFECNGDYTSFSYISAVTNKDGVRFYTRSSKEGGKHNNKLIYVMPNGDEKLLFSIGDDNVDVEVVSFIDDALYFNVSNSKEDGINGLYRVWLGYNEAGDIIDSNITLRFNQNLEPIRAKDNTLLLRSGEQYYIFDTQTGECSPYN